MVVYLPGGPAAQLANLSFFLAALVSDVLLIRFFLVSAYLWLLVSACLGLPKWPAMESTGGLAVDTIIWACLCLCFHGLSLFRLLFDERRIRFKSEDEEQLWRFMYRRGGMPRLEFKQVLKYGRWQRVAAGQPIIRGSQAHLRFFVLVEGLASLRLMYKGVPEEPRLQCSGSCFDLNLLNVFGIYIHFEKSEAHLLSVDALTDCLLYSWSAEEMSIMATRMAPAVGAYWRNFSLCTMGLHFGQTSRPLLCATGEPESEDVLQGGRSRDFTDPLRGYESQRHTLPGILRWLRRSFHPFPPPGLRHNQLPVTGIMARNRLIALKTATATAAIEQEGSASGWDAMHASEASAHGGRMARDYLVGLQSLRRIDETTVEELLEEVAVVVPRMHLQRSRSFSLGGGGRRRSRSGSGSGHGGRGRRGLQSAPTSPIAKAGLAWPAMLRGLGVPAAAAGGSVHGGAGSSAGAGTPPGNRGSSRGSGSGGRRSGSWSHPAGRLLSALRSQSLPEAEAAASGAATTTAAGAGSPAWGASSRSAIARAANAGSPQALHPLHIAGAGRGSGSGLLLSEYDIESRGNSRTAGSAAELRHSSEVQQSSRGNLGHGGRSDPSLVQQQSDAEGQPE
ncbi:hypothetical protein ABPG75_006098 [Micractinium tetrahymenae]